MAGDDELMQDWLSGKGEISDPHLVSIDYQHEEIHEGNHFHSSFIFTGVANGALAEMLVILPSGTRDYQAHMLAAANVEGDCHLFVYEDPTVTVSGAAIPRVANNRANVKTARTIVFLTPTITVDGTYLGQRFVPGGRGPQSEGGQAAGRYETIMAMHKSYLFRLRNVSGQTKTLAYELEWYEESD